MGPAPEVGAGCELEVLEVLEHAGTCTCTFLHLHSSPTPLELVYIYIYTSLYFHTIRQVIKRLRFRTGHVLGFHSLGLAFCYLWFNIFFSDNGPLCYSTSVMRIIDII